MSKLSQLVRIFTQSPLLWGVLGAVGFYSLIYAGPLDFPFVRRYFTGHPVEYMETALFAVGLAAMVVKMFDTAAQRAGLDKSPIGPATEPQSVEECDDMLEALDRLPLHRQGEYYTARLRAGLEHVRDCGSANSLGDELKYLSDMDASRLHAGYGLFRVIVWAIPILGFLGTVIGITMMLGGASDLAKGADSSAMFEIFHGLALKFDTTSLALTFSILLMFVHFFVERSENRLLEQVDHRVQEDLAGRFAVAPTGGEGHGVGVRQIAEVMLRATESLVERQAELWQASTEAASRQWTQMAQSAAENVREAMVAATGELTRQAEVLRRAIEAAGEVGRLEDALNRNLAALAGGKHFEQTALSLAAAVNMLGAQLKDSPGAVAPVRLNKVA